MKRALKIIIVFLLLAAIIGGAAWYFLSYNPQMTAAFLRSQGEKAAAGEKYDTAIRYYRWAAKLTPEDKALSLDLANVYAKSGNYTKAEFTLVNAISQGATLDLYTALCRVYVDQDKLLDAVTMLDQIADPALKAQVDALRPAAPTADQAPGYYSQYIDVALSAEGGTLYVSITGEYPSINGTVYSSPIHLPAGETTIGAVVVSEDKIVSPYAAFGYTVSGVVEPVVLQDKALDTIVRDVLSRGADSTLLTSDLWGITELTLTPEVEDFSDLRYFTGLTSLTIQGHPGIDTAFLASMSGLTHLDLTGCDLTSDNLAQIGACTGLTELRLGSCGVSNVAALGGCVSLVYLDLSDNSINDISALAACTQLKELHLQHNALTSVQSLSGLKELTVLDVSSNSLTSVAPIFNNVRLNTLDISSNKLSDLSGIGRLTELTGLSCAYNSITACDALAGCTELVTLDISNNALETMDGLDTLVNMTDLNLSYNSVVLVPAFPKDCALKNVDASHNALEDVSGFGGLENLSILNLDYNEIDDVSSLAQCPILVTLSCFGTNVTDVDALLEKNIVVNYDPS